MSEDPAAEILRTIPPRIQDILTPWVEGMPDHAALVEGSGTWSYRQLSEAIARAEVLLRQKGVRAGDRVMIVAENSRVFVALMMGTFRIGAWAVPVNAHLSAREVDEIRDHCSARCVIYTTKVSVAARQHAKRHGAETVEFEEGGTIGIGPLNEGAVPEPAGESKDDAIAVLVYTSGTTGKPKGVMLTHKNILFVGAVASRIRSLTPEDRLYGVLPISHIVGLSVVLLGTLMSGATLYLESLFNPVSVLGGLEKHKITIVLGVPSMYSLLVEYAKSKGIEKLSLPSLRIISCSGAPLYLGLKQDVERLLGMPLHNAYGVSEMAPNVSQIRVGKQRNDISVGPLIPGVKARLIGKDGSLVPEGEVGELRVIGPNMMKGYYKAPEETAAAFDSEGWFNTRDLARFEGENLFIVGRSKELIVRFGFNVYPAEVEAVLNGHPDVARSAVIGRAGVGVVGQEEVIAFIELAPGSGTTSQELSAYAAQRLAPYKQPNQILIVQSMPQTATGKIIKGELAKLLATEMPT